MGVGNKMKIVKFTGSQKQFFKAYPMEMRSFDVVYELTNSTGTKYYRFLDTLGEKNFKHWVRPTNDENIFDLTYLDDLPVKLKDYLFTKRNKNEPNKVVKLIELFNKANRPLSISELIVGFYRVNKIHLKRQYLTNLLVILTKKGLLSHIRYGLYQLNRKSK